jgi:hypothetical protein
MKQKNLTIIIAVFFLCSGSCVKKNNAQTAVTPQNPNTGGVIDSSGRINVTFNRPDGEYNASLCIADFGNCDYWVRPQYSQINNQTLRIKTPAGNWHNDGGIGARATLISKQSYTLEYQVKFDSGFQWVKGGKLPGLAGGTAPTGGNPPTDGKGFSARFMWRQNGLLVAYLYYIDQNGQYGEDVSTGFYLPINEWVNIKQYIQMNTGSNTNGKLQVWVNGVEKINKTIRWMTSGHQVNKLYFDTFFGGNDASWAPSVDCYTRLDNMKLW